MINIVDQIQTRD